VVFFSRFELLGQQFKEFASGKGPSRAERAGSPRVNLAFRGFTFPSIFMLFPLCGQLAFPQIRVHPCPSVVEFLF